MPIILEITLHLSGILLRSSASSLYSVLMVRGRMAELLAMMVFSTTFLPMIIQILPALTINNNRSTIPTYSQYEARIKECTMQSLFIAYIYLIYLLIFLFETHIQVLDFCACNSCFNNFLFCYLYLPLYTYILYKQLFAIVNNFNQLYLPPIITLIPKTMFPKLTKKGSTHSYHSQHRQCQPEVRSEKNLAAKFKYNQQPLQAGVLNIEDYQKEIAYIKEARNRTQIRQKEAQKIFYDAAQKLRETRDQLLTFQQTIYHLTDQKEDLLDELKEFQNQQSNSEDALQKKRKLSRRIQLIKGKIQLKEASKADLKDEIQCLQKTKLVYLKHIYQLLEHMTQLQADLYKYRSIILQERSKFIE